MGVIHMICGPIGAGKTTYAIKLAEEQGAVRFTSDDWISELFLPDEPEPITTDWWITRHRRCEPIILAVSWILLELGKDVIWDMGFMYRSHRDRIIGKVADTPYSVRIHFVDAPGEIRRERVRQRNLEKPEGYVIEVTDEMFDFFERYTVPVSPDEAQSVFHVNTAPDGMT